jgi:putative transposase
VVGKFAWQEGFGVFSYSESQVDTIVKYINEQEKHHKTRTFQEEYIEFLKLFDIEYDERYTFKEIE